MADSRAELPSLSRKTFHALVAVSVTAVVVAGLVAAALLRQATLGDAEAELARETSVVAAALDGSGDRVSTARAMDLDRVRLTLVAPDGTVLYDSQNDASQMVNHGGREEVLQALSTGVGSAERMSATVGYVSVYRAVRLSTGEVVRLSVEKAGMMAAFTSMLPALVALVALLVTLSYVASRSLTRRLVDPIVDIDPTAPQATVPYGELMPLACRIDEQQAQLKEQMYRLEDSEQMRREFTSNVTHELKTPLSSISGAAELIRDGIARPADVPDFAGRIVAESARLTDLVNDILTLSKLDESERAGARELLGSTEEVDLLQVALNVRDRLRTASRTAGVTLSVRGEGAIVAGSARLLDELVYNLCDNAIRYNHPGGTVEVEVSRKAGRPVVSVADTGIGIAAEQQEKVFERFYRVDACRSRESGGTGLGLAIVKHAALFHGATIDLASEQGTGTCVIVTFPAQG
jgi:two-component system phosphate regulon sensor histidine kinase PhoR